MGDTSAGEMDECNNKRTLGDSDDDSGDENPKKKQKSMFENLMSQIATKFDTMGKDLKAHIDSRLDSMNNNRSHNDNKDNPELSTEDMGNMVQNCKNITELNCVIEQVDFKKEEDVRKDIDGYFCSICFDGVHPSWNTQVTGAFQFDILEDSKDEAGKQSREFRNLKTHVKNHLNSKTHQQRKELLREKEKTKRTFMKREEKIGLNIFRTRYLGIKQGKSLVNFEEDMLKAKLNDEEIGDTRHGRKFAKKLDNAIYDSMKADMRNSMNIKLDATKMKRPAGFVMDKMTPRKRTGQIHAVVVPVPENSLSKDLLVPMMLELPPPTDLSAEGLAETAKTVFNEAGFSDDQLEGIGWDGEYVKKGVKKKLLEMLKVPGMCVIELDKFVTEVWEPAHQLELATGDIKKDITFEWFDEHIKVVKDTTSVLNIGNRAYNYFWGVILSQKLTKN